MSIPSAQNEQPQQNKRILVKPLPKYMLSLSQPGVLQQQQKQPTKTDSTSKRRGLYNYEINQETGENLLWTVNPFYELPIKLGSDPSCMSSRPPTTIIHQFIATVEKFGSRPALSVSRNNVNHEWTWSEFFNDILTFARSAIYHGFEDKMGTSIIGFNSPEWVIANVGTIFANGVAAGIYTTNNADASFYVADHSESFIVVAEDVSQTDKFIKYLENLTHCRVIIQYTQAISPAHAEAINLYNQKHGEANKKYLYTWADFMKVGNDVTQGNTPAINSIVQERMIVQQPGGTTGNPKAVMLSHDNLTWTAAAGLCEVDINENDRFVSYLPLSHVAAQILDIYIPVLTGASVTFATPNALKGELVQTLQQVRPTVFFGVPRVWEKIYETMKEISKQNNFIKRSIILYAKGIGYDVNVDKINKSTGFFSNLMLNSVPPPNTPKKGNYGYQYYIFKKIIFNTIKQQLGLDQTRFRATAAAPISKEILDFYIAIDLPLLEIYGMSESTGPHTINLPHRQKLYSVGTPFPGAYMMLDQCHANNTAPGVPDTNDLSRWDGEICMWGRHVCMGYLKDRDNTKATIDNTGYLHTGDVGRIDQYGFLSITGRIKELLITAGGENVAPVPIEDEIKASTNDIVSNVMVIGDKQKYLTAFITLKCEELPDGSISTFLTPSCYANIINATSEEQTTMMPDTIPKEKRDIVTILQKGDDKMKKAILSILSNGIKLSNSKAVSNAAKVTKFVVLPRDFTVFNGELTPTMKLKRKIVMDKYRHVLDLLYPPAVDETPVTPLAPVDDPMMVCYQVIDVNTYQAALPAAKL